MQSTPSEFSQLRSLMNQPSPAPASRQALWKVLNRCATTHPEFFAEQWRPYLEECARHWEDSLTTLHSIQELEHASTILPIARFALDLEAHPVEVERIQELTTSGYLAHLIHLNIADHQCGDTCVKLLAVSPHQPVSLTTQRQRDLG